jgi:hypothetical protein
MKTEEDEAFDDLAKRQGSWGGGFTAKRQMAADKLQDGKCKYCVDGCIACDARAQPAQEREALKLAVETLQFYASVCNEDDQLTPAKTAIAKCKEALAQPAQDVDYWIREATAARQAEMAMRRELETQPAQEQRPWVGLTEEDTKGFTSHEMTVVKYVSKVLQELNT